jgi:hypothetical protein
LLVGSSWDSFQVQHHRRQGPRRGKEAASQASHVDGGRQNRSTRRPTLDRCINQRLHTLQRPDPGAVRLLHFGRSTPAALLATHQLYQYRPIADDAISCNLLAPTRCGPLAHFSPSPSSSPFPRGAAVARAPTSARFLPTGSTLRLFFYSRRTTVSRACSIGSVENKALHVPVTSGGIGRLHLLPIAYCLPIAHLLP